MNTLYLNLCYIMRSVIKGQHCIQRNETINIPIQCFVEATFMRRLPGAFAAHIHDVWM